MDAEGYAYDECAVVGSKPLSELVSSDKSGLRWYDESGNEIVNPVFDTSAAGEYVCYLCNKYQAGRVRERESGSKNQNQGHIRKAHGRYRCKRLCV